MSSKRTFIILLSVHVDDARDSSNLINAITFEIGGSVQATASDVKARICKLINFDAEDVQVETLDDFITHFNTALAMTGNYLSYVRA